MTTFIFSIISFFAGMVVYKSFHKKQTKVTLKDTYLKTKRMSEQSLRTQMAVKLANEVSQHLHYKEIAPGEYEIELTVVGN